MIRRRMTAATAVTHHCLDCGECWEAEVEPCEGGRAWDYVDPDDGRCPCCGSCELELL